ncbi:MAG: RdgB/HAM1 family non-canonical purine NTP pyrophosphatase [Clostridia bacterium]|nr:RdgB/HAM1 family non-canonical purine NTP pyrophosphatase [Clostridia bacterium]
MKLIIASSNPGKLREIRAILGGKFDEIVSMREAGIAHETVEDGKTFQENAYKKAYEIAQISGCAALADDSGICVDALDGAPGIYSARFCGRHGDDEANNRLLVEKLQGVENRKAHYACAVALVYPNVASTGVTKGNAIFAEGTMEGEIIDEPRGSGGFGYDPYFYLPEYGKTAAEISPELKNRISHRAKALKALLELL